MAKLVLIKDDDKRVVIRKDIDENVSPLDILVRSDFIAMKTWCREDIATSLRNEGYEDTDENINEVVNSGYMKYLEECTDSEWQTIYNAIDDVAGKLTPIRKTVFENITKSPEALAEFLINFKNTFGEEEEGTASCLDWLNKKVETNDDKEGE